MDNLHPDRVERQVELNLIAADKLDRDPDGVAATIRRAAEELHAEYPQYDGHVNPKLHRESVMRSGLREERWATVYSVRNGVDTAIDPDWLTDADAVAV